MLTDCMNLRNTGVTACRRFDWSDTMPTDTADKLTAAQQLARDCRELADWLDEHPEFPVEPMHQFHVYATSAEQLRQMVKELAPAKRIVEKDYVHFIRKFGELSLKVFASKDRVCKKVKVMREVEEWQCPDFNGGTS
jgi:DNA-binding transcriptional regulator YiaG